MVRHFLVLMTFHAVSNALTSFSFYRDSDKPKGIGFLETLKTQFIYNNLNSTRNNMKSQIQNKSNSGIGELLITLNKIIRNQGTYFVVIMNNRLKIISVLVAPL